MLGVAIHHVFYRSACQVNFAFVIVMIGTHVMPWEGYLVQEICIFAFLLFFM